MILLDMSAVMLRKQNILLNFRSETLRIGELLQ